MESPAQFLSHWQIRERPFEAVWSARYFYGSPHHLEALNRLLYAAEESSMNACLLTGEIGCGKTLTRAVFAHHLDVRRFQVVVLEQTGFSFDELLSGILRKLEARPGPAGETRMEKCERFKEVLERAQSMGRHVMLILDEAQDMDPETLHQLRWLINFNANGQSYLTVVLIGQPELRQRIARDHALAQRISLQFHLNPLSEEDIVGYLVHRLRVAGHPTGLVFTEDAVHAMFEASKGVPRDLNRIAKLALECAWVREARWVDATSVRVVVQDLGRHPLEVIA